QPELKARLRAVMARSYLGLFEPRRARDVLTAALDDAERAAEPDSDALRSMHLLMAQALLELTELDEAERYMDLVLESLDGRRADLAFVSAKVTQSALYYGRGDYDRAAEAAEDALSAADR